MINRQIVSSSSSILVFVSYWLALFAAFVLNSAFGRHSNNYFMWVGLALLPLLSNSVRRLRLLPDSLQVDYLMGGLFWKTRRFPLATSTFTWKQVASFRGGTHPFLFLRATSTMRIGALDGFELSELENFYRLLQQAQQQVNAPSQQR
jgi:hypothetical protein